MDRYTRANFTIVLFILTSITYIIGTFLYILEEGKSFNVRLDSQEYKEVSSGVYSINQTFKLLPLPLMECDSYQKNIQSWRIPELGSNHYQALLSDCTETTGHFSFFFCTLTIILAQIVIYLFISLIHFKYYYEIFKVNVATLIIFPCLISISMISAFISPYPSDRIYPLEGTIAIENKTIILTNDFKYCWHLKGDISNGFIDCENVSYVANCYNSYNNCLESEPDIWVTYSEGCSVGYKKKLDNDTVIFIILSSFFFLFFLISLYIVFFFYY